MYDKSKKVVGTSRVAAKQVNIVLPNKYDYSSKYYLHVPLAVRLGHQIKDGD